MHENINHEVKNHRQPLEKVIPLKAPFVVYIDPCGACNFKCSFCPCNNSDYLIKERHHIMEWDLFDKIVHDLKEFYGQIMVINLHGFGEPLMNSNIVKMVEKLKEFKICREVRLTTNGSLLTEDISRGLIDAGIDTVRVSIEALNDEDYQTICKSPVKFEQIIKNIEQFYRLSRNKHSKITAKAVSVMMNSEEDRQFFYNLFSPITDYQSIEDISNIWGDYDINGGKTSKNTAFCKDNVPICAFPFTDMMIHSNGAIGTCCSDWKLGTQYAWVQESSLKSLWNGDVLKSIQLKHLDKSAYQETFCKLCERRSLDKIDDVSDIIRSKILSDN